MSAALIGLIGVVAGALLGGVVNSRLELHKRRTAALASGRLIANELASIESRMRAARNTNEWWEGKLPDEMWVKHAKALAVDIRSSLVDDNLAVVYRNIAIWNESKPSETPKQNEDLKKDLALVKEQRRISQRGAGSHEQVAAPRKAVGCPRA
jgi:hypothetical protein